MADVLSTVYFPTAVALGALHALEPGHAKALTAAYLIGIKGTKRDSIVLGLAVAATHSCVVVGISAFALWVGREAFAGEATHWLEVGSGAVAVSIGVWMLQRRLRQRRRAGSRDHHDHHHHHDHHASDPQPIKGRDLVGVIEIVETPIGERLRFAASRVLKLRNLEARICRPGGRLEILGMIQSPLAPKIYMSNASPEEPHEFAASLHAETDAGADSAVFEMREPKGHGHDHALMDDDEHARAHAATLPAYVENGERPSTLQILAFGAAGGMVPCPASITVMLLALSVGKTSNGLFAVLGFSLGLATTLVGVGLLVVTGLSRVATSTGRVAWLTQRAPVLSSCLVIVSGLFALSMALFQK